MIGISTLLVMQTVAIVGGTVHTVSGPVFENGVVVMEAGIIIAVGAPADVVIPAGARRVDAAGRIVTPGLFDASTAMGLVEVGAVGDTRDASFNVDDPIRAAFRVTDAINVNSVAIPVTRLGGVTTVLAAPSGGVIAGVGAVIDLRGPTIDTMLVSDRPAMFGAFNPNAAAVTGGSRGGLALRLREVFEDARVYGRNQAAYERGAFRAFATSRLDLAALQPVLAGDMPLVIRTSRAADIDAALRITSEYGVQLVILGGEEAWMRAEALAVANVPVILKPLANLPVQFDRLGTRYDNAAILRQAGVRVVISSFDTHNARELRYEAGNAVRFGMEWHEALRAVTLAPAEVFSVDSHGSIEIGKTANVVIWSGDPFEISSVAEQVFIGGVLVDPESRQTKLRDRYLTIDGLPAHYRR